MYPIIKRILLSQILCNCQVFRSKSSCELAVLYYYQVKSKIRNCLGIPITQINIY